MWHVSPERLLSALVLALALAAAPSCSSEPFGVQDAGMDADAADAPAAPDAAPDLTETKQAVGEPCIGPSDCVEEAYCIGTRGGDFECMARCRAPYALCEDGSVCTPVQSREDAICYTGGLAEEQAACSDNLDCASGLLCIGSGEFYCRRACDEARGGCEAHEFCQRLSTGAGICRSTLGTSCQSDEACQQGLTCTLGLDPAWDRHLSAGYCSIPGCTDDSECPAGAVCRVVPGAQDALCLQACDHVSDCRFNGGYRCLDASACDAWPDVTACRAMFGSDSLCIVP